MPDNKGVKVEKFKVTPEHQAFQKKYKRLTQIRDLLQSKMLMNNQERLGLTNMMNQLAREMQTLKIPKEGTFDLPGMNFQVEEQESFAGADTNNLDLGM